jgi:hypothetical protein
MEIYIVRIYRRNGHDQVKIAGQVEIVASGENKAFVDIFELERILGADGKEAEATE